MREEYRALEILQGFLYTVLIKSSSLIVSGSSLSWVCGMKYSLPGRTSRTELIWEETCLILSRIIPLSSQKIILLCFPISSMIRTFLQGSPSSLRCSSSNSTTLSSPGCRISAIRALPICLRSSFQKFGAVRGLTLFFSVK